MKLRIVPSLVLVVAFGTVGTLQKIPVALHPRLNELDRIDEFADVIGSVKLNPSNFEQQLNLSQYNLVLFYAPWFVTRVVVIYLFEQVLIRFPFFLRCEYCLKILPEWADATKMMSGRFADLVRFAQVDCIAEEALCSELDIRDCPTVRVYKRGPPVRFELVQPYDLQATVEYMQDYLFNSGEASDSGGTD